MTDQSQESHPGGQGYSMADPKQTKALMKLAKKLMKLPQQRSHVHRPKRKGLRHREFVNIKRQKIPTFY